MAMSATVAPAGVFASKTSIPSRNAQPRLLPHHNSTLRFPIYHTSPKTFFKTSSQPPPKPLLSAPCATATDSPSASPATFHGPCYVLGNNIDTDQIISAEHLTLVPSNPDEYQKLGSLALSGLSSAAYPVPFVETGSFTTRYPVIIAGANFGCGSSREHAPVCLGASGCRAVVAEYYARIFFRNSGEILGMRRLEDAIHGIIVRRSAPDWLPFVPGSSYWVPPPRKRALGLIELVGNLANPLSEEESLSLTTPGGWPSLTYFVEGATPHPAKNSTEEAAAQPEEEE